VIFDERALDALQQRKAVVLAELLPLAGKVHELARPHKRFQNPAGHGTGGQQRGAFGHDLRGGGPEGLAGGGAELAGGGAVVIATRWDKPAGMRMAITHTSGLECRILLRRVMVDELVLPRRTTHNGPHVPRRQGAELAGSGVQERSQPTGPLPFW